MRQITVAAGATLDLAGNGTEIINLSGGGAITDSGAAATLTLNAANFSGAISGPLSLVAGGAVILSGANTYTGTTAIDSGDSLQIGAGRNRFDRRRRRQRCRHAHHRRQQRDHACQCDFRRRRSETDRDRRHVDQGRQHLYRRHDPFGGNARHRQWRRARNGNFDLHRRRASGNRDRDLCERNQSFHLRQHDEGSSRDRHDAGRDRRDNLRRQ